MSNTKSASEMLNSLYSEYGLIPEDIHKSSRYSIITRSGIEKIQGKLDISITYHVEKLERDIVVLKASARVNKGNDYVPEGRTLETFGEATLDLHESVKLTRTLSDDDGVKTKEEVDQVLKFKGNVMQNPPYLVAMAEKRAMSRAVLKLARLYEEGFFGEDESDDFRKEIALK